MVLSRPNPDPAKPPIAIDVAEICVCDLRDVPGGWAHEELANSVNQDKICIDPRLGRVLLGANISGPILGSFHSGFSRPIGGGEYERTPSGDSLATQRSAARGEALQPHLDAIAAGGRLVIEDSLTYAQTPVFKVDGVTDPGAPGIEVVVTARNGARPLIALAGDTALDIGARGTLVLEGLVISGGALQLAAAADLEPRELVLRDCTLVPGLALQSRRHCGVTRGGEPGRRAFLRQGHAGALHHRAPDGGRRCRGRARGVHRRCRRAGKRGLCRRQHGSSPARNSP